MEPVENEKKTDEITRLLKTLDKFLDFIDKIPDQLDIREKNKLQLNKGDNFTSDFISQFEKKNGVLTFVAENVIFRCHPFESTSRTNCISNRALPSKWSNVKNNENRNRLSLKTD